MVLGKSRRKREKILDFVSPTRVRSHQQKTFRRFVGGSPPPAPAAPTSMPCPAPDIHVHVRRHIQGYTPLQLVLALVFVRALILSYTAVQGMKYFVHQTSMYKYSTVLHSSYCWSAQSCVTLVYTWFTGFLYTACP